VSTKSKGGLLNNNNDLVNCGLLHFCPDLNSSNYYSSGTLEQTTFCASKRR